MAKRRKPTPQELEENWLNRNWRPAAAVVYLIICLFDFIVVPGWIGTQGESLTTIVAAVSTLSPEVQMVVMNHRLAQWQPLTLMGGGMFHLAFGAILGATAWSRGQEKITQMKQNWDSARNGTPVVTIEEEVYEEASSPDSPDNPEHP